MAPATGNARSIGGSVINREEEFTKSFNQERQSAPKKPYSVEAPAPRKPSPVEADTKVLDETFTTKIDTKEVRGPPTLGVASSGASGVSGA